MSNEKLTGYPSIDKPWLKYYSEEAINAPLPECTLYEYLWDCNKDHLDDYALNYFGNKITYRKFFRMIDTAAKAFTAIGVCEEDIVSIVSVSTVASVACFYALNRIGAVSNYLNVLAEKDDLKNYFAEAGSKVVVMLDLFADKVLAAADLSSVKTVIAFPVDYEMPFLTRLGYKIKSGKGAQARKENKKVLLWKDFLKRAGGQAEISYKKNPHKMALLAHTGGTTGEPKAVMLDDCAMNAAADQYRFGFTVTRGEKFLNIMIPFVIYGILANVHIPITLGLENVIVPKFDYKEWATYMKRYKPNHILTVPSYVFPIIENEGMQQINLEKFISIGVGGDGLTEEMEEKVNVFFEKRNSPARLMPGYGLTETCATATGCFAGKRKVGSIGIPLPKNNIMIYDRDNEKEMTYCEVGEICLQCPSRMIGYMNNEEATKELFWIHNDGSEWLHTGDLGYVDEDGFLFLVGRMKRIILTTRDGVAYKVFPNMTEKILEENENVMQSCVVGAMSEGNQVLKAYIVMESADFANTNTVENELRKSCEDKLPSYARPTFYEFRDSLPLTAAGKVDYRALEDKQI